MHQLPTVSRTINTVHEIVVLKPCSVSPSEALSEPGGLLVCEFWDAMLDTGKPKPTSSGKMESPLSQQDQV